ncbi:hypothetical protein D3C75_1137930 [compost metagenome]
MFIEHLGIGDFLGRGDQSQCFGGRGRIIENHGGFYGVVDRTGDQVQVVVGVDPQRQQPEQGQGHTGHGNGH